jgi:Zn-dependent alcohol dehydrogenase
LRGLALLKKLSPETLDKLVRPRYPLAEINEALITAEKQETVKVVIAP